MATASQSNLRERSPAVVRLAPEFDLLCACCSADVRTPRLSEILASPLHWERLLELADRHRVLPALSATLRDRDDVPASIQSAIRARNDVNTLKALRFSAELVRITGHLANCGIHTLAHKGPALAQKLYGDPAMRQFGDLDLLISARDIAHARTALAELGYEPGIQLSRRQERAYLRSGYEYVFGLGSERNLLELQWQIVPRFYSIDFDMEALFERLAEFVFEGFPLRMLGNEDLLLVLCVHAAKHEWSQLGMLRDISTLVWSGVDWTWIIAEARRLGIMRLLGISLYLAGELFDIQIPEELARCSEVQGACAMTSAIRHRLSRGGEVETESPRYFREMMNIRERWQDRTRLAWRLGVTPSVGEWQAVRLPDPLLPLYRAARILRLARRLAVRSHV